MNKIFEYVKRYSLFIFAAINGLIFFDPLIKVYAEPDILKNISSIPMIISSLLLLTNSIIFVALYRGLSFNYRLGFIVGNLCAVFNLLYCFIICAKYNINIFYYSFQDPVILDPVYPIIMLIYLNLFYKRWFQSFLREKPIKTFWLLGPELQVFMISFLIAWLLLILGFIKLMLFPLSITILSLCIFIYRTRKR